MTTVTSNNITTICLNMIVKDEAHIIRETLESVKKYIHFWVIADTGSTDGTQEIIKNYFDQVGIPGKLVEHKWQDFGTNRTLALEAALKYANTDYIWVMDADDLVVGDLNLSLPEAKDAYYLKYGSGFTYDRMQIFSTKYRWRYVGVLHEYPECVNNKNIVSGYVRGNYYIDSRRLGARNLDPEKYLKDANILEKGLEKEPDNVRYMFYLGQSWMDYGDMDKAIYWYNVRAAKGGWVEEVYYSYYRIAKAMTIRGDPWPEIEKAYLKAWAILPARAEPLYEIAKWYQEADQFNQAYEYAKRASLIPYPNHHRLFLSKDVYDWKIWDVLSICSYYISKYQESFDAATKALLSPDLSDNIRRRIERNRDFNVDHIKHKYAKYPVLTIKKVLSKNKNSKNDNTKNDNTKNDNTKNDNSEDFKPRIAFTITTCKRLELFKVTMNSFLNCCKDVNRITDWYCIDDNSSAEDREVMQKLYPFFNFVWKDHNDKGHAISMNMIIDIVKNGNYTHVLHMEDDWQFFEVRDYIADALDILSEDASYGQALFNKNYAEIISCRYIPGGIVKYTKNNQRYILHEHYKPDSLEYKQFQDKVQAPNNAYWAHYSLRPSLLKTEIFDTVGLYSTTSGVFELEYSYRYRDLGYKSCFIDTISCLHTGKKTWERGENAYTLNQVEQFVFDTSNNQEVEQKQSKDISLNQSKDIGLNNNNIFLYIPSADSPGNDICYINDSLEELFVKAEEDSNCIAFNTIGYLKNGLEDTMSWKNISSSFPGHGIFIHKNRYLKYLETKGWNYTEQRYNLSQKHFNILGLVVDKVIVVTAIDQEITVIKQLEELYINYEVIIISDLMTNIADNIGNNILVLAGNSLIVNLTSLAKTLLDNTSDILSLTAKDSNDYIDSYISKEGIDKIINNNDISNLVSGVSSETYVITNNVSQINYSIQCINLERRPDRKASMVKEFSNKGVTNYNFYQAVDGKQLILDDNIRRMIAANLFLSRRGVIGIAKSSLKLWNQLIADPQYNTYLIFEDDVTLCEDFGIVIDKVISMLADEEWDMVKLGYSRKDKQSTFCQKIAEDNLSLKKINYDNCVGGLFGYLINKSGAVKLTSWISENGLKEAIDIEVKKCYRDANLKLLVVEPNIVYSPWLTSFKDRTFDTDIHFDFDTIFEPGIDKLDCDITITTCKRLNLFTQTMDSLWKHCKDLHRVRNWYCIDDQSKLEELKEMRKRWPFLTIVSKPIQDVGHRPSIEMLPRLVTSKYVFHLEDDWFFHSDFYLADLISALEKEEATQVICVKRWGNQGQALNGYTNQIYNYTCNPSHSLKPDDKKIIDQLLPLPKELDNIQDEDRGWWWPGFSFNPGVWKANQVFKYLPTSSQVEDFEYELSRRMFIAGEKILFSDLCKHTGNIISSYILNHQPRSHELKQ